MQNGLNLQKFVPRSRGGIFRNERTRWYEMHQNMSLGSNGVDRVLSLRNVCATKSCQNFSQRTHPIQPIGPKLMFWCVSYDLGAFGTVKLPYKTQGKMFRTSAKVRATKSRRSFLRRTHLIHPLDPILMFWCVSYHFGAFGTIWLLYQSRSKTLSRRNFAQQTHLINPIEP